MAQHRFINPEGISIAPGYTHVVETTGNRTVYISGQVAFDGQGNLVGAGDMKAQAEQVFKNLELALAAVGATFNDVVKLNFFVTDAAQMPAIRDVRNRYINLNQPPASTAIEVKGMIRKELLLEVEAIAILD